MSTHYLLDFVNKTRQYKTSFFCLAASCCYLLAGQPTDAKAAPRVRTQEELKKILADITHRMANCGSKSLLDRLNEKREAAIEDFFAASSENMLLAGTDSCPGTPIPAGTVFSDSGDTTGGNNTVDSVNAGCLAFPTSHGPDKIYKLVFPSTAIRNASTPTCTITSTPTPGSGYDTSIYMLNPVGTGCPAGTGNAVTNCVAGKDNGGSNTAEQITDAQLDALPAGTYFVFVDSFYNSNPAGSGGGACTVPNAGCFDGPYTLNVSCQTLSSTASLAGVGGRVMTADGRGIANAKVSVVLPSGESRFVLTSPFGFYHFDDIEVGSAYVFQASHKQYEFPNGAQLITVSDSLDNVNFTAAGDQRKPNK